jgi:uncharacterized alpha-E superfamily protein
MISRVAESCFWLTRYLERVENTSRILSVNRQFLLDMHTLPPFEHWQPIITVLGEEKRFNRLFADASLEDESEQVQHFCTWDERNPAAIITTLKHARDNARVVRETMSMDMWQALNALWLWLAHGQGLGLYHSDRHAFYQYLIDETQLFQGLLTSTIRHDEPFTFLNLGLLLERASQTARMVDLNYQNLQPHYCEPDMILESARWLMILRCCSASVSFFKNTTEEMSGQTICQFLLCDTLFPRSVLFCLEQAKSMLSHMQQSLQTNRGSKAIQQLSQILVGLDQENPDFCLPDKNHEHVTHLIAKIANVHLTLQNDFFAIVGSSLTN